MTIWCPDVLEQGRALRVLARQPTPPDDIALSKLARRSRPSTGPTMPPDAGAASADVAECARRFATKNISAALSRANDLLDDVPADAALRFAEYAWAFATLSYRLPSPFDASAKSVALRFLTLWQRGRERTSDTYAEDVWAHKTAPVLGLEADSEFRPNRKIHDMWRLRARPDLLAEGEDRYNRWDLFLEQAIDIWSILGLNNDAEEDQRLWTFIKIWEGRLHKAVKGMRLLLKRANFPLFHSLSLVQNVTFLILIVTNYGVQMASESDAEFIYSQYRMVLDRIACLFADDVVLDPKGIADRALPIMQLLHSYALLQQPVHPALDDALRKMVVEDGAIPGLIEHSTDWTYFTKFDRIYSCVFGLSAWSRLLRPAAPCSSDQFHFNWHNRARGIALESDAAATPGHFSTINAGADSARNRYRRRTRSLTPKPPAPKRDRTLPLWRRPTPKRRSVQDAENAIASMAVVNGDAAGGESAAPASVDAAPAKDFATNCEPVQQSTDANATNAGDHDDRVPSVENNIVAVGDVSNVTESNNVVSVGGDEPLNGEVFIHSNIGIPHDCTPSADQGIVAGRNDSLARDASSDCANDGATSHRDVSGRGRISPGDVADSGVSDHYRDHSLMPPRTITRLAFTAFDSLPTDPAGLVHNGVAVLPGLLADVIATNSLYGRIVANCRHLTRGFLMGLFNKPDIHPANSAYRSTEWDDVLLYISIRDQIMALLVSALGPLSLVWDELGNELKSIRVFMRAKGELIEKHCDMGFSMRNLPHLNGVAFRLYTVWVLLSNSTERSPLRILDGSGRWHDGPGSAGDVVVYNSGIQLEAPVVSAGQWVSIDFRVLVEDKSY